MGNKNDKKERINVVYSTNPNYQYEYNQEEEQETLAPEKQNLRVTLDSKQRKGKTVTLVQGFTGTEEDLKELAKLLKNKCGVGGSVKDGEIIIQGEVKEKVLFQVLFRTLKLHFYSMYTQYYSTPILPKQNPACEGVMYSSGIFSVPT